MVLCDERQPGAETGTEGRRRRARIWLAVLLCAGMTAIGGAAGGADHAARMQEPVRAPVIPLRDADDRTITLRDFQGQVVLVEFWASWCPSCTALFPELDALHREYRNRGVQVVAINVDARRRDAMTFLRKRRHAMRILFDPRAEALEAFGAAGVPSVYLIDREGYVRYGHAGSTVESVREYRREIDKLLRDQSSKST